MSISLAIIGAGNMAEAIARSLLRNRTYAPAQLTAADVSPQRRELFQRELGIRAFDSPASAVADAERVLLAVKPQQMSDVLHAIAPVLRDDALVVSIAAGVPVAFIESQLQPRAIRVVRTMPNTPVLVGAGMVAIAPGTHATASDLSAARKLFEPAATVIEVSEDKLDAVTALSGSGPAYFFFLVEQMIRAGVEMGLTEEEAATLARRTAVGAGRMLEAASEPPGELRRRVTSPGGTTEAAIEHMQLHQWHEITAAAIHAAQRRGRDLAAILAQANGIRSS